MWCGANGLAAALGRLQARWHWASRLANVVSCGAMLVSAMFDPISADEDHRYCEMAGRFTIPLGLAFLLLFALLAGPSRMDLAAWLPLYVATVSLLTISLAPILGRRASPGTTPTVPSTADDLESSAPTDDDEAPPQDEDLHHLTMARWEREPAARYHLLDEQYHRLVSPSARTPTTLSLSSTPGQTRSSWGSRVLGFWPADPLVRSGGTRRQQNGPDGPSSLDGLLDA